MRLGQVSNGNLAQSYQKKCIWAKYPMETPLFTPPNEGLICAFPQIGSVVNLRIPANLTLSILAHY